MAELKTKKTQSSVADFLKGVQDEEKRKDCLVLIALMEKACKAKAKMWGDAIIGFGDLRLKYDNGRELDWFVMGFSPRKQNLALYIKGAVEKETELRKTLGKHKTGKGCLYINKISEIDLKVLSNIIEKGLK